MTEDKAALEAEVASRDDVRRLGRIGWRGVCVLPGSCAPPPCPTDTHTRNCSTLPYDCACGSDWYGSHACAPTCRCVSRLQDAGGAASRVELEAKLAAATAEAAEHLRVAEQTRAQLAAAQAQLRSSREAISEMQSMLDQISTQMEPSDGARLAELVRSTVESDLDATVAAIMAELRRIAGDTPGPAIDRLEKAVSGTAALSAQLQESEGANFELAGLFKAMRARAQAAEAEVAALQDRLQKQRDETARLERLLAEEA